MTQRHQLLGLVCHHRHTNALSICKFIHLGNAYIEKPTYSEGLFSLCSAFLTVELSSMCLYLQGLPLPFALLHKSLPDWAQLVHPCNWASQGLFELLLGKPEGLENRNMGVIISSGMHHKGTCFVNCFDQGTQPSDNLVYPAPWVPLYPQ